MYECTRIVAGARGARPRLEAPSDARDSAGAGEAEATGGWAAVGKATDVEAASKSRLLVARDIGVLAATL